MKTTIFAATAACMMLATSLSATAARAGELLAGLYAHGVGTKQSQEGGVDPLLGYRTDKIDALWWLGRPAVHVLVAGNTNVPTDFIAAGFDWRLDFTADKRWYIRPGIGLAYTTGKANIGNAFQPGLTPTESARRYYLTHTRIDFGSHTLFEPELALGYQISPRWTGELTYLHLSNGQILHHGVNQGLDDIGLRLAYRFGGH